MKKNIYIKQLFIFLLLIIFLNNCSSVQRITRRSTKYIQETDEVDTEIIITAIGDLTFGGVYVSRKRKYIKRIIDIYRDIEKKHGSEFMYKYPFKNVITVFSNSDITICNWECVSSSNVDVKRKGKKYYILGPPDFVNCAKGVIDIANLANNHILDYGYTGMWDTKMVLNNANIKTIGIGSNIVQAREPVIIKKKGIEIGFLGYTPYNKPATENEPGVAGSYSFKEMKQMVTNDINTLSTNVDYVIVTFHWGEEYENNPNSYQTNLGRLCIDAGAHLVIGHHSHSVQGLERYKNGLICYSLGNFIFGANTGGEEKSFILKASLKNNKIYQYEIVPVYIFPVLTSYQPKLLEGKEKEDYIQYINSLTPPIP